MVKFETLKTLTKNITEKETSNLLRYGKYLIDAQRIEDNSRHRIIDLDGHTYYHGMKDGETIHCFEIAISYVPFNNVAIWSYTPDGMHEVEIDSRWIWKHEVKEIRGEHAAPGDSFNHKGHMVVLVDCDTVSIDSKKVKVKNDSEFIYKFMKKQIFARDGARGLFEFMEHIAFCNSDSLYGDSCFKCSLDKLIELYGDKGAD